MAIDFWKWTKWSQLGFVLKELFLNKEIRVVTYADQGYNRTYSGICGSIALESGSDLGLDQVTGIIKLKDVVEENYYGDNEKKEIMKIELNRVETIQAKDAFYKNSHKKAHKTIVSILNYFKRTAFQKLLKAYSNQKIAVLCNRYTYRGILSEIGREYLILSDAAAVERSGASNVERPVCEDPINGSLLIMAQSVELIFQPKWCFAPLPNEIGYLSFKIR